MPDLLQSRTDISFHLKEKAAREGKGKWLRGAIQRWHLAFFLHLHKCLFCGFISAQIPISCCPSDYLSRLGPQNEKVMAQLYSIMFDKLYLHVYLCLDHCVSAVPKECVHCGVRQWKLSASNLPVFAVTQRCELCRNAVTSPYTDNMCHSLKLGCTNED